MLASTAISEILRVVNNQNRSTEAMLWLQETLREIGGMGRWSWLFSERIAAFAQNLLVPDNIDEICEPILLGSGDVPTVEYRIVAPTTSFTMNGTVPSANGALTATIDSVVYSPTVTVQNWTLAITSGTFTAGNYNVALSYTDTNGGVSVDESSSELVVSSTLTPTTSNWAPVDVPVNWEDYNKLTLQRDDFRFDDASSQLVINTRWTTGPIRMRYYRKFTIPALTTDALDLPDQWAYRLSVYGAARHGLIGEDDFDRLAVAEGFYQNALREMREHEARRKVANSSRQLGGAIRTSREWLDPFPSNFSL